VLLRLLVLLLVLLAMRGDVADQSRGHQRVRRVAAAGVVPVSASVSVPVLVSFSFQVSVQVSITSRKGAAPTEGAGCHTWRQAATKCAGGSSASSPV